MSSILGVVSSPSIATMIRAAARVTPRGDEAVSNARPTAASEPTADVEPLRPTTSATPASASTEFGVKPPSGGRRAELSTEDELALRELVARDAEVRSHEQAHVAAGGQYVNGGATYSYEVGPDGRRFAVEGEVNIDVSKESDPAATIRKAQVVRQAALAPADPSAKDRMVASRAAELEREARAELAGETAPTGGPGRVGEGPEEPAPATPAVDAAARPSEQDAAATPASSEPQLSVRV